jgi:hypothetical protein
MRLLIAAALAALLVILVAPATAEAASRGPVLSACDATDFSAARKKAKKKKAPKEEYLRAAPMAPEPKKK